jgi:hypothetical protein
MGASFASRRFTDKSESAIEAEWEKAVKQSLHENGHSYSGDIGMFGNAAIVWNDKSFKTADDAYEYIEDNHKKWKAPWGVSYEANGKKFWIVGGWVSE